MALIRDLSSYSTSRDYGLLFQLAKKTSIVCFVDFLRSSGLKPCRDVAQTIFRDGDYNISARGIGYLWAETESEFVSGCNAINLEFVLPNVELANHLSP